MGRYWRLARTDHADYAIHDHSNVGELLTFRGKLMVPRNMTRTILYEYHNARGHFGQKRTQEMIS